jgi:antirestriction protein ArdC
MMQCLDRGITPGPLATFKQWEALGRHVLRGQKAIVLCVPITTTNRANGTQPAEGAEEENQEDASTRTFFTYRSRWFVLSQTDGEPYEPVTLPAWSETRALASLGVVRIPFEHHDGNAQGYATANREVAISPIAALPHKTLFHEVAHILLGHPRDTTVGASSREVEAEGAALLCCEALDLDGAAYARGYLQHWLRTDELTDAMAQRIIKTAHQIINAGADPGNEQVS